jgi:hypothetical protein
MIRLATNEDTKIIVALLREFLKETSYKQATQAADNLEHLCKIVWTAQQYGYIWLGYVDDEPVGLLIALKEPNVWLPQAKQLKEFVWFVLPKYRSNSIGGKLFLNYCRKGDELLKNGSIQGYFTTRMTTTDPIDYEGRGFRLTEQTFIKD